MRKLLFVPVAIFGLAACNGGGYGGPPATGYYTGPSGYSSPYAPYYSPTPERRYAHSYGYGYRGGRSGQCTFQTRRGPVPGYVPEGKNRCCIQTREGQSCQ